MIVTYLRLMFEFAKTGLFAVGGGLATLPFLYEMAEKTGWFTKADILNLVAISESTPGAIGINMATYVGFLTGSAQGGFWAGLLGGILATISLAAPSIVVIVLISKVLKRFKESPLVQGVFKGLRPASTGLIAAAGISVAEMALLRVSAYTGFNLESFVNVINWKGIVLAVILFIGMKKFKAHPIVFIAIAALVGILIGF